MSTNASASALRHDAVRSRDEMERLLRQACDYDPTKPYIDVRALRDYDLGIGAAWRFYLNVVTGGDFRTKINRFAHYDSPLVWAVRGRHLVCQGGDSVYYNTPEDVRAICEAIKAMPAREIDAAMLREQQALYDYYIDEGIEPERVVGLVGERDEIPSRELWEELSAFYERAAEEGRYVVCWIST